MADLVVTPDGIGYKRRNPWGVVLLSFVTIGIYGIVWYYKINNELKNYGIKSDPLMSTLALTIGSFIIVPPFVSYYKTGARILQAQEKAGSTERMIPVLGLLLWIVVSIFAVAYYQSQINKAWDALAAAGADVRPA